VEQQPQLRSHIIERRCAASEGWRSRKGADFAAAVKTRNASRATGSISRLDQKNYATAKPIVAKITRLIK
jgi:hypothetical protein